MIFPVTIFSKINQNTENLLNLLPVKITYKSISWALYLENAGVRYRQV